MREENERRILEQVHMSHAQDHFQSNRGAYDAVGVSASAGYKNKNQHHLQEVY